MYRISSKDDEKIFGNVLEKTREKDRIVDVNGNELCLAVPHIEKMIRKALDDRITAIFTQLEADIKVIDLNGN